MSDARAKLEARRLVEEVGFAAAKSAAFGVVNDRPVGSVDWEFWMAVICNIRDLESLAANTSAD